MMRSLFGTSTPTALRPGIGARMRTSSDAIAYWMSLLEAGDAVDLHARAELELVAGDGRADGGADEARVDAVVRERGLEDAAALVDEAAVGLLAAPPLEQRWRAAASTVPGAARRRRRAR